MNRGEFERTVTEMIGDTVFSALLMAKDEMGICGEVWSELLERDDPFYTEEIAKATAELNRAVLMLTDEMFCDNLVHLGDLFCQEIKRRREAEK